MTDNVRLGFFAAQPINVYADGGLRVFAHLATAACVFGLLTLARRNMALPHRFGIGVNVDDRSAQVQFPQLVEPRS